MSGVDRVFGHHGVVTAVEKIGHDPVVLIAAQPIDSNLCGLTANTRVNHTDDSLSGFNPQTLGGHSSRSFDQVCA